MLKRSIYYFGTLLLAYGGYSQGPETNLSLNYVKDPVDTLRQEASGSTLTHFQYADNERTLGFNKIIHSWKIKQKRQIKVQN